MRKLFTGIAAALLAVGFSAGPAAAAPTVGSSCQLSANWTVRTSATWYGAELAYVVITSPGRLFYGTGTDVRTEAYAWVGDSAPSVRHFTQVSTSPDYTYRANFTNRPNATLVGVYAESYPNSAVCYTTMRHP